MRRPVKPFVTEYRGGSRRPSGQGSSPGLDVFKQEPAQGASPPSSPWPPSPPPSQGESQEDGYEAALRAADALFADARPAASEAPRSAPPIAAAGEATKPTPPTTGRVLRVLDEPPTAEMLALQRLEAEHAPKKRGRKPGSKNKPKVAALVAGPGETAAPPAAIPPIEAPANTLPAATVTAALAARAIATAPTRRPDEPKNGERYAWVRTRLKPGQQWKRRLPKVAW